MVDSALSPEELRAIAQEESASTTDPCPFCGTEKVITRIGDHIHSKHRAELYEAVALYREQVSE